MAKEQARIVGALGFNGRVYRSGQEKALAAAAKEGKLDLARFAESGVLTGDWSGDVENVQPATATPELAAAERVRPAPAAAPAKKTTAKKTVKRGGRK